MTDTTEQSVITGRYRPKRAEHPMVVEAMRFLRQVLDGAPDANAEHARGWVECAALGMAVDDPWCQEAEDVELWRQCARMHDARPANDGRAVLRRTRAWKDYIRTAAEWQHADQAVAS